VQAMLANALEIAALVEIPQLLRTLGFEANERTRRCACVLHGGSNPTAFAWREDGHWRCFSCGLGGDRIELVCRVRGCGFREAVHFLAQLAGVEYRPDKLSRHQLGLVRHRRERAAAVAWLIRDEVVRLRCYYNARLHRAEYLWRRIGENVRRARCEAEREAAWEKMARFAPVCTYFLAAWHFTSDATPDVLVCFVLASAAERRAMILGESHASKLHVA